MMTFVKRIVVDVLKPHQPSALEFSNTILKLDIIIKRINENDSNRA